MREVNRSAIVVRPKQPFLKWLQSVDLTSSGLTLQELRQEPDVYLIPECESEEDFTACLREMFPVLFEVQLEGWWTNRADWPANRTFETFHAWFDCRFHSMVIDLDDYKPLIQEQI